jgi:hypothetical protein
MTLCPVIFSNAGARSRNPDTTPMPPSTVISAAMAVADNANIPRTAATAVDHFLMTSSQNACRPRRRAVLTVPPAGPIVFFVTSAG